MGGWGSVYFVCLFFEEGASSLFWRWCGVWSRHPFFGAVEKQSVTFAGFIFFFSFQLGFISKSGQQLLAVC